MARIANDLPRNGRDPGIAIAYDLRAARQRAGNPSLARMAAISGVCTGLLSKAQNGDPRLTWRTVKGWALACGEPLEVWQDRWREFELARRREAGSGPCSRLESAARSSWIKEGRLRAVPGVRTLADLTRVLDALCRHQGLSLRALAGNADTFSHTTYHEILQGRRPLTVHHLTSFLTGCRVPAAEHADWITQFRAVTDPAALPGPRPEAAKRRAPATGSAIPKGRTGLPPQGYVSPKVAAEVLRHLADTGSPFAQEAVDVPPQGWYLSPETVAMLADADIRHAQETTGAPPQGGGRPTPGKSTPFDEEPDAHDCYVRYLQAALEDELHALARTWDMPPTDVFDLYHGLTVPDHDHLVHLLRTVNVDTSAIKAVAVSRMVAVFLRG